MTQTNTKNNLFISATSASFAELITLPICTIKTNYQNTESKSIKDTITNMYRNHGIKGFYKASIPSIGGQALSTSSKYTLYRYFESHNHLLPNKVFNAVLAGILSSLVTHPIDAIKVHKQMNVNILPIIKINPLVLYRGYSKTFSKILVSSSLFLPLYDTLNKYYNPMLASFGSAIISTCIMHPIDYLKTRHIYGLPLYSGINPISYYKGIGLNLARIVPHFTIMMTMISYLSTYFS